jgi:hypothetical protein
MVERSHGTSFVKKPVPQRGIANILGEEELQCDCATQPRILGTVDDSHPADAKQIHDAEVGHHFPTEAKRVSATSSVRGFYVGGLFRREQGLQWVEILRGALVAVEQCLDPLSDFRIGSP